jgi:hypothetical protein
MSEYNTTSAPIEEDERHDDLEFNPALEPQSAKAWLNLLQESEDAFEDWNKHCDRIDKQFASLERLSQLVREKEFSMFWANCEVLKPSIYAKPPVPVVVPKFNDRRPVYQQASEMAERCAVVAFDLAGIDELMTLVRDDLSMASRGVAWCRYESGGGDSYYEHEKVCIDFKNRRDFLHSISRNWREVTWVAAASYLTRSQARARFRKYSGDEYQRAEYRVDKDSQEIGGADARERAKIWEIWDKSNRRVVWVAEGCENILDEDDAHLELREFFPCPKPVYGTVQRGSLIPVPDVLQYRDQLEEINLLTSRIHALSDALEVKGFYPAGGAELSDAIQSAIQIKTPGRLLVPIANWAAFGGTKDVIIWLPIDQIAQTITQLVALRKEVISDIYQIMGLSDIMRGATDPNETLGAQQLKTQYGSTRIRDKQQEMVRIARDLVEITLEIITEKFKPETMIEMSQSQLPTDKMKREALQMLQMQATQLMQQMQQQAQQPPPPPQQPGQPPQQDPNQALQQQMTQLQQKMQEISQKPTTDQVFKFLKDNRAKSFVLDIETDSTILQDENAEKQRRTEFVQMLSGLLQQMSQMYAADPTTGPFLGEVLKFSVAPFRAGRALDGAIDEFVQQMEDKGKQPRGDDPQTAQGKVAIQIEQMKVQAQQQTDKGKLQLQAQELQMKDQHKKLELQNERDIKMAELQAQQGDQQAEMVRTSQQAMHDRESHQADMIKSQQDMELQRQKADLAVQAHQLKSQQAREGNALKQQALNQKGFGGLV